DMSCQGDRPPAPGDAPTRRFRGRLHFTTMTEETSGDEGPRVPVSNPAGFAGPTLPTATEQPSATFTQAAPSRTGRPRRIWLWALSVAIVVAIVVASRVDLNEYAIQPGTAQSVQQFITVPKAKSHPVTHPVLLTDVQIARVSALSYLYFKVQGNTAFESVPSVTGGTPPSQQLAQGQLEMSQAETAAKTAALTRLGYRVTSTAVGAVVAGTFAGTPAYPVLNVGDVITAIDGVATPNAVALTMTLDHYHSGQTIELTVLRNNQGAAVRVPVTLKRTLVDVGLAKPVPVDLGIQPENQVDYTYPFPVSINVTNIGGPSAGLAMTLGVMDALTNGSLTGSKTVAATGTMDSSGDVGDVGGVPQKTVAVENAGATIFLVPPQEYSAALSKDRPGLKIFKVSTLNQALSVLAANSGHVPPLSAATSTTPTSG
ncbi:MAG: S16 family serine protease, partial [Acidimicrobiales bacterium]